MRYRKAPKFLDVKNFAVTYKKFKKRGKNLWVFQQKDATVLANSGDPDQTAPLGAV